MTGPSVGSYYDRWGPGSPQAASARADWLRGVDSQYLDFINSLEKVIPDNNLVAVAAQRGISLPAPAVRMAQDQASVSPRDARLSDDDKDLIAAARFFGIPDETIRQMPRQALVAAVNTYKAGARGEGDPHMLTRMAALVGMPVAAAGRSVMQVLNNSPLVPDALRTALKTKEGELWYRELEQGIRASLPEEDQSALTALSVAGMVGGTWYPGMAGYNLAIATGRRLPLVGRAMSRLDALSPIARGTAPGSATAWVLGNVARGSAAGAATGYVLEGEGEHKNVAMIGGAALGGVLEGGIAAAQHYAPQMQGVYTRLTRAFRSPHEAAPIGDEGIIASGWSPEMHTPVGRETELRSAAARIRDSARDPQLSGEEQAQARIMADALDAQADNVAAAAPKRPVMNGDTGRLPPELEKSLAGLRRYANDPNQPADLRARAAANADHIEQTTTSLRQRRPENPAMQAGAQLTKRDIVAGANTLPETIQSAQIDDLTVVRAAMESNPGGVSVIPHVEPRNIIQGLMFGSDVPAEQELIRLHSQITGLGRAAAKDAISVAKAEGATAEDLLKTWRDELADLTTERPPDEVTRLIDVSSRRIAAFGRQSEEEARSHVVRMVASERMRGTPEDEIATRIKAELDDLELLEAEIGPAIASTQSGVQGVAPNQLPIVPNNIRFATRRGSYKLDAIVSDQPISDDMVRQYERHGVYQGQTVLTPNGKQGTIVGIGDDGMARVKPAYGGSVPPYRIRADKLMPNSMSEGVVEAPAMYDGFKGYVTRRWAEASSATGGAPMPGWLDEATTERLGLYLDDFFNEAGVTNIADQARIRSYFNIRRVEEFQLAVPEANAAAARAETMLEDAIALRPAVDDIAEITEASAMRGYQAVPMQSGRGYVFYPRNTPTSPVAVADDAAARDFLRSVNEDMPDLALAGKAPVETARSWPTVGEHNPSLNGQQHGDRVVQAAIDTEAAAMADEIRGMRGGGGGNPPDGPGGVGGDDIPDELPENSQLREQMEAFKKSHNYGRIMDSVSNGVNRRLRAMNSRLKLLERDLGEAGFDVARPWKAYQELSNANDVKHNWSAPWHDRWAGIMQKISWRKMSNGEWTRVYEIDDDIERLARAKELGWSEKEIESLDDVQKYFSDIFPETGIEAARQIRQYISHVRQQHYKGVYDRNGYGYDRLNPHTDFFAEHLRLGLVDMREMDPRVLGPMYVNALGFKKFVQPSWEGNVSLWNAIAKDPDLKPLANVMTDWMKVMRRGYTPSNDLAVDVVQAALSPFLKVSRKEAAELIGAGLSSSHNALLGLRPDVLLRDSIQPLLAVPRVGTELFSTMGRYLRGSNDEKRAIWQRGVEKGWIQVGRPRIESPGMFNADVPIADSGPALSPDARGRKVAMALAGAFRDMAAPALRGLRERNLTPLSLYTRLSERNRLFVGESGYQHALKEIAKFRAGGSSYDDMVEEIVGTYDAPVKRRFREFIDSGLDDQAATLMGNELANVTQFRYGTLEGPEAARSMTGRVGMQFGNFSLQFHAFASEALRNGNYKSNAKFLTWMGAVATSLKLAKETTGWNFDKWQFYNAYTFTGSPWFQQAAETVGALPAVAQELQGKPVTEYMERQQSPLTSIPGDVLNMLNPVAGGMRTVERVNQALQSSVPAHALGGVLFTGEPPRTTERLGLETYGARALESSLLPSSSPVRSQAHIVGATDEAAFQQWYSGWAQKAGLDPNPDSPLHKYDYRAAFRAGATPQIDPTDGLYHWPSQFKAADHPNRFVNGVDTRSLDRIGAGSTMPPVAPRIPPQANTRQRVYQSMPSQDDLSGLILGQADAIEKFSLDEIEFVMGRLVHVPPPDRYRIFQAYRQAKATGPAGSPTGVQPPVRPASPGSGSMF